MANIDVVLYHNFTALDVFGPVEVLSSLDGYQIHYVSLNGGVVENRQSIRMETEPISAVEGNGVLLIPGGFGSRAMAEDDRFLGALASAIDAAQYVLCVCTGSALAAKTKKMNGRRATSNKTAFDWVRRCGPDVLWNREARWIRDGKFYTSAGVSAGTDMALGFVRDLLGEEKAAEICRRMEYHWNSDAEHDIF